MLPSIFILLMMVALKIHTIDIDVGEMFYNFRLSSLLAKYCKVDLGYFLGNNKDRQGTPLWMRCVPFMMGLALSPYADIQGLLWESEAVRGDSGDPDNSFRWDTIKLNLPGDPNYPPTISWMSKV